VDAEVRRAKDRVKPERWRRANPEKVREQARRYRAANRAAYNARVTARRHERRAVVLKVLGGECAWCCNPGPGPIGFLDVDHINGDGAAEKSNSAASSFEITYRAIRDEGEVAARRRYQLLCPNCHRIKSLGESRSGRV
jgi:hypothetical protein